METIGSLLVLSILWLFSNWKTILVIGFGLYIAKQLQDKVSFYEEKLLDIDDNVKQVMDRLGMNND